MEYFFKRKQVLKCFVLSAGHFSKHWPFMSHVVTTQNLFSVLILKSYISLKPKHSSPKCSDTMAEYLVTNQTEILTEQILLQGLGPVQVHVVLLKDVLEQLRPLGEAVGQVQMCEMNYQVSRAPLCPQDHQRELDLNKRLLEKSVV